MIQQAYLRDAKATYNDIVWWPQEHLENQALDVAAKSEAGEWTAPTTPIALIYRGGADIRKKVREPVWCGEAMRHFDMELRSVVSRTSLRRV